MKVDAGCSCRQVDPAQLPATVRPGKGMKLAVSLSGKSSYSPENFVLTFLTDQGQLTAPVTLLSIPRHRLSPDSITLSGLDETSPDEAAGFDLIHREVYEAGTREVEAELVIPTGFVMESRGLHEGKVAGSPDLDFTDTSDHLTIKDRSLGLRRADLILKAAGGRKLVEAPQVWQRLPFLSSVPERIALTARPIRVGPVGWGSPEARPTLRQDGGFGGIGESRAIPLRSTDVVAGDLLGLKYFVRGTPKDRSREIAARCHEGP